MTMRDVEDERRWRLAYEYACFQVGVSYKSGRRLMPGVETEDIACAYAMARSLGLTGLSTFWEWAIGAGMAVELSHGSSA